MFKDNAGNWSSTFTVSITLDATPPSLTLSTMSPNSWTKNPLLNIEGTLTDTVGVKSLTINGNTVTPSKDGTFAYALTLTDGANTITTIARDNAGNETKDTRVVNLDRSAPHITMTTPTDNSKTREGVISIAGTVDETFTVMIKVNNGTPQATSMNGNVFTGTATLSPGINTIECMVTDRAENTSTVKSTVTYDNQNPALSLTEPSQDITTKGNTVNLKGEVSDVSNVTIIITKEGESYKPPVVNGKFEQVLTFSTPKTYQISVTAVDETGNETSVQRNIVYTPTIHLNTGWNFISFPIQPTNSAIESALSLITNNLRIVWGYDNETKQWLRYKPGVKNSINTLDKIEGGKGYWLYMDGNVTLDMTEWAATPLTIHFYSGWNFIGYNGIEGKNVLTALRSGDISQSWEVIWTWTDGLWSTKIADPATSSPVPALNNLNQGKAYWIRIKPGMATDWTQ